MATEIVMPKLGLTMTEGRVSRWLKNEGEVIKKGEPVVEVTTEKATTEVESPGEGILGKILVEEGTEVEVGTVIGVIVKQGEEIPTEFQSVDAPAEVVSQPSTSAESSGEPDQLDDGERDPRKEQAPPINLGQKVRATPKAKKMAKNHGLDLTGITGSGPQGRIVSRDVEKYLEQADKKQLVEIDRAEQAPEGEELKGLRKVIADRMSSSAREKPHVTLNMEADPGKLLALHGRIKKEHSEEIKISFNDLLVKAVGISLRNFPELNGYIIDSRVVKRDQVNMGIAVAAQEGLVVPVIKDVNSKSLKEVSSESRELIERARNNSLKPEDVEDGTFTVTNLGMFNVLNFTPIINPPEIAILGIGKIKETPVVKNGRVVPGKVMHLSLSFDHRAVDGAEAAQFLNILTEIIQEPEKIWVL